MLNDWLSRVLIPFTDYDLTIGGVIGTIFATIIVLAILRLSIIGLNDYSQRHSMPKELTRFVKRMVFIGASLFWTILTLLSLNINLSIWKTLTIRNILIAALLIIIARIADKIISARLLEEFDSQTHRDIYKDQYGQKNKSNITKVIRNVLFIIVTIILINNSEFDYEFQIGENAVPITISNILLILLVILIARLLLWMAINLFLYGWYRREKVDMGKQYAYNQLLSYVVFFFAILVALQYSGINLTLLWAGAAALLVGVGIALQQVISDFFSGLVILFERSVEVGDFLDFGDYRGTVKKIGLRASIVETLERKDVIIPNSHLVNDRVTNWTSTRMTTRFEVSVGVTYGSDTKLVNQLLLEAAALTNNVLKTPNSFVRFENFGDNSLDFTIYFFSDNIRTIEDTKSALRFHIDDIFRKNGIAIPFPQRDLWIKSLPAS